MLARSRGIAAKSTVSRPGGLNETTPTGLNTGESSSSNLLTRAPSMKDIFSLLQIDTSQSPADQIKALEQKAEEAIDQHKYSLSFRAYEQALLLYKQLDGDKSLPVAFTLKRMGDLQFEMANPRGSIDFYEKARSIFKSLSMDLNEAETLHSMGESLYLDRDFHGANARFEQEIGILRKAEGDTTERLALALYSRARILALTGTPEEAMDLFKEAESIQRRIGSSDVATTLRAIGNLYMEMKEYKSASSNFNQAANLLRQELGENKVEVAESFADLAESLDRQMEFKEAAKYYDRAISIRRHVVGEQDPEVGLLLIRLGAVQKHDGNFAGAANSFEQALMIFRPTLGDKNEDVIFIMENLGEAYLAQKRYAEAIKHLEDAHLQYKIILGSGSVQEQRCKSTLDDAKAHTPQGGRGCSCVIS